MVSGVAHAIFVSRPNHAGKEPLISPKYFRKPEEIMFTRLP